MSEVRTIDLTPTWAGLTPFMLKCLQDEGVPQKTKDDFCEEIMSMAKGADAYNDMVREKKKKCS